MRAVSSGMRLAVAAAACGMMAACTVSSEAIRSDLQPIDGEQFRYVSTATMMHPVNSRQGEHYRMTKLAELLRERGLCPAGYTIESRDPPLYFNNDSRYEYAVRDVTYIGRCKN